MVRLTKSVLTIVAGVVLLIPGFHLIDRDFVLRSDSCGHHPADNLYTDLLPMLGSLAK